MMRPITTVCFSVKRKLMLSRIWVQFSSASPFWVPMMSSIAATYKMKFYYRPWAKNWQCSSIFYHSLLIHHWLNKLSCTKWNKSDVWLMAKVIRHLFLISINIYFQKQKSYHIGVTLCPKICCVTGCCALFIAYQWLRYSARDLAHCNSVSETHPFPRSFCRKPKQFTSYLGFSPKSVLRVFKSIIGSSSFNQKVTEIPKQHSNE